MIQKTKDYNMFIFRDDNREKIDQAHVQKLIESIKARNLLDLRPICVNEKMEVIDGQHRLLAAKALGLEIWYQQDKKLKCEDIVRMNISKPWTIGDYLNFYCQHQYKEYIKLKNFMKKHNLSLKVALNITLGQQHITFVQFKAGEFKFKEEELDDQIQICWESIDYIKKMNGFSPYTSSSRFWKALLRIIKHPEFDEMRWRLNMQKMIEHFVPKARTEDYISAMSNVYNYRATSKINFMDE
jgi:hypothetical protein